MKRKNDKQRVFASFLTLVLVVTFLMGTGISRSYAATSGNANYYNVMLVLDGSGSLVSEKSGTDKEGYRYEATKLFLGLLTDSGNNVGAIVFDKGIIANTGLQKITGSESKSKLFAKIDGQVNPNGDTNIGIALDTAVEELVKAQSENGLPSVVVMLTDGKTDLDNNNPTVTEEEKKALEQERKAVERANEQNIKIYSVLLNGNGNGSDEEIKLMANGNPDQYKVVTTAKDLQGIFEMFYTLIYGSYSKDSETIFDKDGYAEVDMEVPELGVEEVNVVISTQSKLEEIIITDPDHNPMDEEDIADATTSSIGFTLIKITKPKAGTWHVKVKGVPNDTISFNFVYNDTLGIKLADLKNQNSYFSGNDITLGASVFNGKHIVTGDQLDPSYLELKLYDATRTKEYPVDETIAVDGNVYKIDFKVPEVTEGTDLIATVTTRIPVGDSDEGIEATSQDLHIAVNPISDNHIPTPLENPKVVDLTAMQGSQQSFDLNTWFEAEDENDFLTFEIADSDYNNQDVEVNDFYLNVKSEGLVSGAITLKATDQNRASCNLQVQFIGNSLPESMFDSTTEVIEKQFFASKTLDIDVTDWFSDADGDALTYIITDSDYENDEVTMVGSNLHVDRKAIIKGNLIVKATDTKNGSSEVTVHFKIRNLALWESIGATGIIGILAVLLISMIAISKARKFKGIIEVESLTDRGSSSSGWSNPFASSSATASVSPKDTFGPFHGSKSVKSLIIDHGGFPKSAKFVVVNARKAKFVSKTPFYITGGVSSKQINLPIGMETDIYVDAECTKGIHVTVMEDETATGNNSNNMGSAYSGSNGGW